MGLLDETKTYRYRDIEELKGSWELIHGIPYNMSPAPSTAHQHIVGEVYFSLRSFLHASKCRLFVAPFDVRFSEEDDYDNPNTVVQPDISVFCNAEQIDDKGGKGAPYLVVEVLSPATALKDRNQKFKLYEQHGVKEYWIIDPANKTVEVYGSEDDYFHQREVFGKDDVLQSFVFSDFSLDLSSVF